MKGPVRLLVPVGIAFMILLGIVSLVHGQSAGAAATLNVPSDTLIKPGDVITRFVVWTWSTFAQPGNSISEVEVWHTFGNAEWAEWQSFTSTFAIYFWQETFGSDGVYQFQARARDNLGVLEPLGPAEATVIVDMADKWAIRAHLPLIRR